MGVLGLLFLTLARMLRSVLELYNLVVIAAVLMTWFKPDPRHPVVRTIKALTDPVFSFVRKRLPPAFFQSGIDFTPMLVFLIIMFLNGFVVSTLFDIGSWMRSNTGYQSESRTMESSPQKLDLPQL